jgi:RNase P subunit RPR2
MRINSYIVCNAKLEQKDFVLAMVDKMLERATQMSYNRRTRSIHEVTTRTASLSRSETPTPPRKKARGMHVKAPKLPQARLDGNMIEHNLTIAKKRSSCKYCSYLLLKHKHDKSTGDKPKKSNVYRKCVKCNVHPCSLHFDAHHDGNAMLAV